MNKQPESHLERRFRNLWEAVAPDLVLMSQIAKVVPGRRYVYDFGLLSRKVLFEINGGTHARGNSGHSSGKGIARDADKVNQAQIQGYTIFVFTTDQLTKEYVKDVAEFTRNQAIVY